MSTLQTLLCIDDEPDILEVAKLALETLGGYQITTCPNGEVGYEVAEKLQPDLILLDVMMPKQDGPTTLKKLKANASTADIPVIFMTAKVQASEIATYKASGVIGVIPKPFDPMTISNEIFQLWQHNHH